MENWSFNEEWTDPLIKAVFNEHKPVCFICNEILLLYKEYNLMSYHYTKHATFKEVRGMLQENWGF